MVMAVAAFRRTARRTGRPAAACACRSTRRSRRTARAASPAGGFQQVVARSRAARHAQPARRADHADIVERDHRRRRSSGPARGPCRRPPARRRAAARSAPRRWPRARSPISRAPGQPASTAARIVAGSSRARIVVGHDHDVGVARSGRAHQRALAAVAVAAGAEHHVQPPGGVRAQRASAAAPAHPACGRNPHRPRRRSAAAPRSSIRPRTPVSAAAGPARRGSPRASASAAASSALSAWNRPGSASAMSATVAGVFDLQHPDRRRVARRATSRSVRAGLADGVQIQPAPRGDVAQRGQRRRVHVGVGHRRRARRQQFGEQPQLGRAVGRLGAVIIEMVARQVGEPGRGQPHAVQPVLVAARATTPPSRHASMPARARRGQRSGERAPDRAWSGRGRARSRARSAERAEAGGALAAERPRSGAGIRPCWSCRWCR